MIYKIHFNNDDINDNKTLVIKTDDWKFEIGDIFSCKGRDWEVDEVSCGDKCADIFVKYAKYGATPGFEIRLNNDL